MRRRAFVVAAALALAACASSHRLTTLSPANSLLTAGALANAGGTTVAMTLSPQSPEEKLVEADERDLEIAILLIERGKHAEAIEVLSALRGRNPTHAGVLEDLIWACIPLADCRALLPQLQRQLVAHVGRFPRDLSRRLTLIDLAEATGSDDVHREQIYSLVRDYPGVAEVWVLAAELALAASDLNATEEFVSRASERSFYDRDNHERLDTVAEDLATAVSDRQNDARQRQLDAIRERRLRRRSLSRRAFHIRLDDGDDF